MVEEITYCGKILALIIRNEFCKPGITFITPESYSQQLAYMRHPSGKIIMPHIHNSIQRQVIYTQEVLLLKKGKLRADFYDECQNYLESRIIGPGDVLLLAAGGHGFEVLEEIEMIEVKQGPYLSEQDKTKFEGVGPERIVVREELKDG